MNRRLALQRTLGLLGLCSPASTLFSKAKNDSHVPDKPRFRIGACDWSIGKNADPEAFDLARQIGLDGIQVNMGSAADDLKLRKKEWQDIYRATAKRTGIQIGGLALGDMNNTPYKSDPRTEAWVQDAVDVAGSLGAKVILLPFFSKGDLKNDPQGTRVVIDRLKGVAPKAEKAGVTLGLESWLNAEELMAIIDAVGSPAVKVYYDVCNSTVMGYDILKEIRWLGKQQQIAEFHFKENGFLLGQGKVNLVDVRQAIDDIRYEGWIHIEGAVPQGKTILESYTYNNKFVRQVMT